VTKHTGCRYPAGPKGLVFLQAAIDDGGREEKADG